MYYLAEVWSASCLAEDKVSECTTWKKSITEWKLQSYSRSEGTTRKKTKNIAEAVKLLQKSITEWKLLSCCGRT